MLPGGGRSRVLQLRVGSASPPSMTEVDSGKKMKTIRPHHPPPLAPLQGSMLLHPGGITRPPPPGVVLFRRSSFSQFSSILASARGDAEMRRMLIR